VTEQEILREIECVAREHVGWNGHLQPTMELVDDLQLDSLRVLALAVRVEEHFGIELDQPKGGAILTVGDLVAHIRQKLEDRQ
jgi:acyl carrier protein